MAQWATVCVAVVNVILLWQGIQARREERRRREKEQAQRVTLGIKEHLERQSPSSAWVLGFTVDVRNDSDRQVHLHRPMLVEHATWKQRQTVGARTLSTKGLPLGQSFLRPGDSLPVSVDNRSASGLSAVLEFRDEAGQGWCRRGDTYDLQRFPKPLGWHHRTIQRVAHALPPVRWLLVTVPAKYAVRYARRHGLVTGLGHAEADWRVTTADDHGPVREQPIHPIRSGHLPLSLRWCRAVWGSWPLGEAEDWLEPGGAPLLWLLWRYDF